MRDMVDSAGIAVAGDGGGGAARGVERLIVFARYPEPGRTKTRLIPALGEAGAADLQRRMTHKVLDEARELKRRRGVAVEVRYAGGDGDAMAAVFGDDLRYRAQVGEGLGARLHGAFVEAFGEGCDRVVTIGSDCPGMTAERLAEAFEGLGRADAVIGPAEDGGYYLIGLNRPVAGLFDDGIEWGSERVLAQTLERAAGLGVSVHRLGELTDVDRPEDLAVWRRVEAGKNEDASRRR